MLDDDSYTKRRREHRARRERQKEQEDRLSALRRISDEIRSNVGGQNKTLYALLATVAISVFALWFSNRAVEEARVANQIAVAAAEKANKTLVSVSEEANKTAIKIAADGNTNAITIADKSNQTAIDIARESNKTAKDQMRAETRPWVSTQFLELRFFFDRIEEQVFLKSTQTLRNYGRIPAVQAIAGYRLATTEISGADPEITQNIKRIAPSEIPRAIERICSEIDKLSPEPRPEEEVWVEGVGNVTVTRLPIILPGDPPVIVPAAFSLEVAAGYDSSETREFALMGCLRYDAADELSEGKTRFGYRLVKRSCDKIPAALEFSDGPNDSYTFELSKGEDGGIYSGPLCFEPIGGLAKSME